jgi:hypothetical protein
MTQHEQFLCLEDSFGNGIVVTVAETPALVHAVAGDI